MRSADQWEGFRSRWSRLDSSGTAIREIHDVVLPTVVVGYDQRDGRGLNYGDSVIAAGGAGVFSGLALNANSELWVEEVVTTVPSAERFGLSLVQGLAAVTPFVFITPPGDSCWISGFLTGVLPEPQLREGGLRFSQPGLLVPAGFQLRAACALANQTVRAGFVFRLSGGD